LHVVKNALLSVAVILVTGMTAIAQSVAIQLDRNVFTVIGWKTPAAQPAGGWQSVFAVYAGSGNVPPLVGTYAVESGWLVFRPTYPVSAGMRYRAVFRPPGGAPIEKVINGPPKNITSSTRVERVYPSGDVLPSNQLRVYIYFSAPMSRGEVGERIRLLDRNGQVLNGAFLPGQELWDPNLRRLTMTFDPGRIKRGLTSNRKMGAPLEEGERYTLVIDKAWKDARGASLVEEFRKPFRGGPAVRTPPDPHDWSITSPRPGTTEPLLVDFARPMNYTLLQRMLQVSGARGPVSGTISVTRQEAEWRFTPKEPWMPGTYRVTVDTLLEDLAGNKIGQPFDVDVLAKPQPTVGKTIAVPFSVVERTTASRP
jgi:hypothetical protein